MSNAKAPNYHYATLSLQHLPGISGTPGSTNNVHFPHEIFKVRIQEMGGAIHAIWIAVPTTEKGLPDPKYTAGVLFGSVNRVMQDIAIKAAERYLIDDPFPWSERKDKGILETGKRSLSVAKINKGQQPSSLN